MALALGLKEERERVEAFFTAQQRKLEDDRRKQQAADEAVRRQQLVQKQAEAEEAARKKEAAQKRQAAEEAARHQQAQDAETRRLAELAEQQRSLDEARRKQVEERECVEAMVAAQQRKSEDDQRELEDQNRLSEAIRKQGEIAEQQRQLDIERQQRLQTPPSLQSQPRTFTTFTSLAVNIPRRELDLQNKISSGATSTVYKGMWRGTNVAVKILRADRGDKAYQALETELNILIHTRHDRVVNLMGVCEDLQDTDGGNVALITQLMARGSLYFVLHNTSATAMSYRPRSLEMRLQLCKDIAEAMRFLHASQVFHKDLKSGNVLVDDDGRAKVADFGMSGFKRESMSRVTAAVGTVSWTAPEVLKGDKTQGKSADVYGFGVIVWELFTGQLPWEDLDGIQIIVAVGTNGERLSIPSDLSRDHPVVSDLITACFREKANRPTFHELYNVLDRLLTHSGPSSRDDSGITALNQKLDVFIKLSQEQFEMVSDLHVSNNLMPHTYVILPRLNENKGIWGWLTSNAARLAWDQSRLHFFCPVTCKFVPCGVDGEGYPLSIPHDWLTKLAPALQFGVSLLKVLVVTRGLADAVDLSSIIPASSSSASSLETLGKMLTCMKKFASGIEDATGEDPLDYLTQTIEGLSADEDAKSAHALVYRFLAKAELNGSDPYPGWKPQLTGLGTEAITPIGGGKSLWVSPKGRDAYLQKGIQAVRISGSSFKASGYSYSGISGTAAVLDDSLSTLVNPTGKHIMISYCWAQKVLVTALAVYLRETHGYDVWIDELGSSVCSKMSGASDAKMAEAVEKSHAVLVFVSKEYNASVNCQKEAKYAHQRRDKGKVQIHYVMLQRDYTTVSKPDCIEGTLALWIGDEIWYSLFEESQVAGTGDTLADLMGDQGKLVGGGGAI